MSGPAARILNPSPNATNGATCATRREAWTTDFDCGAGPVPLPGVTPPVRWSRRYPRTLEGLLALPREPNGETGRLKTVTHRTRDFLERRRDELNRDRGSRLLTQAVAAQRRLDAQRADMFRVEVLTETSGRDPKAVFTKRSASEMLDNEQTANHLVEREHRG